MTLTGAPISKLICLRNEGGKIIAYRLGALLHEKLPILELPYILNTSSIEINRTLPNDQHSHMPPPPHLMQTVT
jgi:hypothetical protein